MPNVGYATLQVIPSMRGVASALTGATAGPAAAAGAQAGGLFGSRFARAFAGGAAILAVVVGLGVAAFQIGQSFDDAYDVIRTGTGATGEALAGLHDDFRATFGQVPADMADVATATADLNTRLGLTGPNLQAVSAQVLELSRITGTDLGTNITAVTRAFGDWSVGTDDMSDAMDRLFRASQATGAPVDQLAQSITDFGSPLRQLGFSMDESIALFGRFEREGVNTSTVMAGMRQAAINLGSGMAAQTAGVSSFQDVLDGVAEGWFGITEARSVFGARAATDVLRAIEEGRFELEDYLAVIEGGTDTILGVAGETRSWRESLELLRNNGLLLVEPVATRVFQMFSAGVGVLADAAVAFGRDGLTGALEVLGGAWERLSGPMQILVAAIGGLTIAGVVAGGVALLGVAFGILPGGIMLPVLAVLAIGAALVWAYLRFEGFRSVVDGVVSWLVGTAWPALQGFWAQLVDLGASALAWWEANWPVVAEVVSTAVGGLISAWDSVYAWVQTNWPTISAIVTGVVDVIVAAFDGARVAATNIATAFGAAGMLIITLLRPVGNVIGGMWDRFGGQWLGHIQVFLSALQDLLGGLVQILQGIIDFVAGVFTGDWGRAWDGIKQIFGGAWDAIGALLRMAVNAISGIIGFAMAWISGVWDQGWSMLTGALVAAWDAIIGAVTGYVGTLISFWSSVPGRIVSAISSLAGLLAGAGRAAVSAWWTGMQVMWAGVLSWFGGLPGRILAAVGNLGRLLYDAGRAVIRGLVEGIESMVSSVTGALGRITDLIPINKGPLDKDRRLLVPAGHAIMDGLKEGLTDGWKPVERQLRSIAPTVRFTVDEMSNPGEFARVAPASRLQPPPPPGAAGDSRRRSESAEFAAAMGRELDKRIRRLGPDEVYALASAGGRGNERGSRGARR